MGWRSTDFDNTATYVARRIMTVDGKRFEQGQPVPREAATSDAQYRRWFEARKIYPARIAVAEPQGKPETPAKPKAAASGGPDASEAIRAAMTAAGIPADLPQHEGHIEAVGRGWFNVHHAGEVYKVRSAGPAAEKLQALRLAAGAPADAPPNGVTIMTGEQGEQPGAAPGAMSAPNQRDEVVDGETGEIRPLDELRAEADAEAAEMLKAYHEQQEAAENAPRGDLDTMFAGLEDDEGGEPMTGSSLEGAPWEREGATL